MNRWSRPVLGVLLAISFAVCTLAPHNSFAQSTNARSLKTTTSTLVQGAVTNTSGAAAGTFSGIYKLTSVAPQNGQLMATGTLKGTITALDGTITTVNQNVTSLLSSASGSCAILNLTLGPLHVDLLGLVINLNQVNLNIVAQPGAGNLLGNLLCDVANLLNGGGALADIANTLNSLLNLLNGL
jgi:hypothetical protein